MIAFLKGVLVEKTTTHALVDVHGIGYDVGIPSSTFEALGDAGEEIRLLTVLHVRESAIALFGFSTVDERSLFLDLLSVSGVGPKLALTILSSLPVDQLIRHIADANESALIKVPGLGKKTAQRLVLDLKERAAARQKKQPGKISRARFPVRVADEALAALQTLGYSASEAERALEEAKQHVSGDISVEKLVQIALKY